MANGSLHLRIHGIALPLADMDRLLGMQARSARDDMRPPNPRPMVWTAHFCQWDVHANREAIAAGESGGGAAVSIRRLLEHLEPRAGALASILATPDAFGQLDLYYTRTREASIAIPPEDLARIARLNLALHVLWTDELG